MSQQHCTRKISIKLPATSANLGTGFDCLGLALKLYNQFDFYCGPGPARLDQPVYRSLMGKAFCLLAHYIGEEPVELVIESHCEIPSARGLGSSATCSLAGILAGQAYYGVELQASETINLAMELEGHPDNAAPALLGGLVASLSPSKGQVISSKLDLAEDWRFIALISNFRLNTSRSRQVLPDRVSFADAVSNSNRLGILLAGLGQFRADLVREGLQDRLHQPYRAALIQGFDEIGELMCAAGLIGSYLSGAGPTIMVVSSRESWQADLLKLQDLKKREPVLTGWSIQGLEVDREGAKLI